MIEKRFTINIREFTTPCQEKIGPKIHWPSGVSRMGITVEVYVGKNSADYIDIVSRFRVEMFKEFPYLYEGDSSFERNYMQGYTTDSRAMIAIARVDGVLAGVSTGIPLISSSEVVSDAKNVFSKEKIDIGDYYYYGEVIVLPKYRGLGLTTKLYAAQDELIKSWGFKHVCILTVIRENDHPLKPKDYKCPDMMWGHLGFFRNKLTTEYHWPTFQADKRVKNVNNVLEFWTKLLPQSGDVKKSDHHVSEESAVPVIFKYS